MRFLPVVLIGALPCLSSSFAFEDLLWRCSQRGPSSSARSSTTAVNDDLETSRAILSKLASQESTQTKLTPEQVKEYNRAIEGLPPPPDSLDVDGGWELLATISPEAENGDNVDFFDMKSWDNYIGGTGPSPFQSLITGSSRVNGLTQWLTPNDFDNVVEFKLGPIDGKLVLKASLETIENNKRVFRFRRGFFLFKFVWGGSVTLPYPVPFNLLGERAIGWLQTIGYDEESGLRAALGNKGTQFIFKKREETAIPNDVIAASLLYSSPLEHETDEEEKAKNEGLTKRAIVICPQQFGGKPGDYDALAEQLRKRGHPVYLARISALEWLSIVKSAVTEEYFKAELVPSKTLPFYMNAINGAVERLDKGKEFTVLSHSIGGWVVRAWLGEVADKSVRSRCKRYVSLGTPHVAPPEDSFVAKVDQTRGLLKYINDRWPGAHFDDIEYTCIASTGVSGKLELNLDSILAYASYFALIGQGDVEGDGITPVKAALLEGGKYGIISHRASSASNVLTSLLLVRLISAKSIVLDEVYHADVLPNPVGGKNAKLIGCSWYADKIDEWVEAL